MKSIIFLIMIIGILCIGFGYFKSNQQCPPPIIQYRYIPRTFEQSQSIEEPYYQLLVLCLKMIVHGSNLKDIHLEIKKHKLLINLSFL